ncbi:sulfurtransferase TusA family protein [Halorubrum sp. SD683]|uniref:sulfurtransferase TusA family protein n=1 Tax=Halorubrum sp. SD683 TaxID=1855873 RepID=UPI000A2E50B9|nr:sulfurtransferase TusA family protein [Halorubrum sp. SD683]OTF01701.1 preprotein translocase subunit TatB [Halorubrum sp. SD683]
MSHADWEDVVVFPEEPDDETAELLLEGAAAVQDMIGEVCPYPQIEAKKAIQRLESDDLLVQETGHVSSTENVPKSVEGEAQVWHSGGGLYRIFRRKA